MNKDTILNQGRPIEPDCFENNREEQWYNIGLFDGANSNAWHSIANGDLPKEDGEYIIFLDGCLEIYEYDKRKNYWTNARNPYCNEWWIQKDISHWMEMLKFPE